MTNAFERLVRDTVDAFGRGDRDFFASLVTDDVRLRPIGKPDVVGKEAVLGTIASLSAAPPPDVTIDHVITHGRAAAVNGTITIAGDDGGKRVFDFCDVYVFSGFKERKLRELVLYVIPIEDGASDAGDSQT